MEDRYSLTHPVTTPVDPTTTDAPRGKETGEMTLENVTGLLSFIRATSALNLFFKYLGL